MSEYVLFLLEVVTVVLAILFTLFGVLVILAAGKRQKAESGTLQVSSLHKQFEKLQLALLKPKGKKAIKSFRKAIKQRAKGREGQSTCFVLQFKGDLYATNAEALKSEVTAVLLSAQPGDEVVVVVNSPGGLVSGYGYAASQLKRISAAGYPLTVIIDQVAASGGYLMASVADHIVAAPFAIVGSIGVVAQLPNFHEWLKHKGIGFEQITAGEYKRTLTVFGENTDEGRKKFKQDLEAIHEAFKQFIIEKRPKLKLAEVATGEHWLGIHAKELGLVDEISTSDDWLYKKFVAHEQVLLQVNFQLRKTWLSKVAHKGASLFSKLSTQI